MGGNRSRNGYGHGRRPRVGDARAHLTREKEEEVVMNTTAMAHLGGATLDNEENYLIKKLFTAGLAWCA